jgi:hypothetical protein
VAATVIDVHDVDRVPAVWQVAVGRDLGSTISSSSASADRFAEGVPSALTNGASIAPRVEVVNWYDENSPVRWQDASHDGE